MFETITTREARVGRTVGHVGAEAAIFSHHGLTRHRINTELSQRWLGRATSPKLAWLREQSERLFDRDAEDLAVGVKRTALFALGDVRTIATVLRSDDFTVSWVGANRARQRQQTNRIIKGQLSRLHFREE